MNSAPDWQSWTTIAVVVITALVFAVKAAGKKSGGCGSCGCGRSEDKKAVADKPEQQR